MKRAAVVTRPIDPAAVMEEIRSPEFGAVSLFVGTVRDVNEGRRVSSIDYSAYVPMAEAEMQRISAEAADRFGLSAMIIEHRVGSLQLGEASIVIACAHQHRDPALDALRYLIEQIKSRVPIWKLEHHLEGGADWIDPTSSAPVLKL
jgi:molybdopterin synthase catalytic subunit